MHELVTKLVNEVWAGITPEIVVPTPENWPDDEMWADITKWANGFANQGSFNETNITFAKVEKVWFVAISPDGELGWSGDGVVVQAGKTLFAFTTSYPAETWAWHLVGTKYMGTFNAEQCLHPAWQ